MPLLEVREVTKRFGGLVALQDVTFSVEAGEILWVIGPNGSGKSTLFNVIGGQVPASAGTVRFRGRPLAGLPPHRIYRLGIGRAFQIAHPFTRLRVLENVLVGALFGQAGVSRPEALRTATDLLERVGLAHQAHRPAATLSLGGMKRLEIAMALSARPELVLLDEILAGLTPAGALQVMRLVRAVRDRGVTVLLIEHLLKGVASPADRVIALDQGRVIAKGRAAEVLGHPQVIDAYLGEG